MIFNIDKQKQEEFNTSKENLLDSLFIINSGNIGLFTKCMWLSCIIALILNDYGIFICLSYLIIVGVCRVIDFITKRKIRTKFPIATAITDSKIKIEDNSLIIINDIYSNSKENPSHYAKVIIKFSDIKDIKIYNNYFSIIAFATSGCFDYSLNELLVDTLESGVYDVTIANVYKDYDCLCSMLRSKTRKLNN